MHLNTIGAKRRVIGVRLVGFESAELCFFGSMGLSWPPRPSARHTAAQ